MCDKKVSCCSCNNDFLKRDVYDVLGLGCFENEFVCVPCIKANPLEFPNVMMYVIDVCFRCGVTEKKQPIYHYASQKRCQDCLISRISFSEFNKNVERTKLANEDHFLTKLASKADGSERACSEFLFGSKRGSIIEVNFGDEKSESEVCGVGKGVAAYSSESVLWVKFLNSGITSSISLENSGMLRLV